MFTNINFMDENTQHVCEFTGEPSCPVKVAIDVIAAKKGDWQSAKKVEEFKQANCTVVQCELLREKARELLAKQHPSLAALPKGWDEY